MSTETAGETPYAELQRHLREAATLASVAALAGWDQETMMPPAAAPHRGEQVAMLSALVHERRTSPRMAELIAACEADPRVLGDEAEAANLRAIRHDHERAVKLPTSLVRAFAEATTMAMHAWRDARERDDFAAFAPHLETVVRLTRERAACFGIPEGGESYDALLEDYEPGMRTAELQRIFAGLRTELAPLIRAVAESGRRPDTAFLRTTLAVERQQAFNRGVVEAMGFRFDAGRLDVSAHPFCESMGPGDTRLTTRYREEEFASALHASMHEAGHGIYEQGLPKAERFGQPLAEAASTGIHESQSRMWENFVGRGRPFLDWAIPQVRAATGDGRLDGLDADAAYRGFNVVEPTLVRIESDEATYNLHIMLRFDLERALLNGDLAVADLPGAWNERIRADLGLEVPDDRRGCLQDIHWSMGGIGYFPTYTLGNLYAGQLWATLRRALPELDDQLRRGEFAPLLGWLRANVHAHGRRYSAPELCQRITGAPLGHEALMDYLRAKLGEVYAL
jgi:carboxypeptidase Taq